MGASSGLRRARRRFEPLLRFAAAMTRRDPGAAARALVTARRAGSPRAAAEEVALMLVLHAGYPAALEASRLLASVWPGAARATREGSVRDWRRRGLALSRRVYGRSHARLLENVRRWHPDLAVWMVEQGYGRVLSRGRLGARERELAAVTVLSASGWERQLVSHLKGAERLGASRAEVERAVEVGLERATGDGRAVARRARAAAFAEGPAGASRSARRAANRRSEPKPGAGRRIRREPTRPARGV